MTIARAAHAIWLSRHNGMTKVDARIYARAALDTIAEPTPEMLQKAAAALVQSEIDNLSVYEKVDAIWREAHAAMVNERQMRKRKK